MNIKPGKYICGLIMNCISGNTELYEVILRYDGKYWDFMGIKLGLVASVLYHIPLDFLPKLGENPYGKQYILLNDLDYLYQSLKNSENFLLGTREYKEWENSKKSKDEITKE